MWEYFEKYHHKLTEALLQHLTIVGISLAASVALASVLTLLIMRNAKLSSIVIRVLGSVYAVPSLALFAILIPFTGIGMKTAILVLTLYNQFLLIRNFIAGLDSVDPQIIEAAEGMGMSHMRILVRIKLPLAFPVILAGIHLAVISTIGIAAVAAAIGAGGIGSILFDGMRTRSPVKLVWGTILAAGLAITANLLLIGIERLAARRLHYGDLAKTSGRGRSAPSSSPE
ncbi:MAG: ABC transporter permease [Clostridiales Family XIII bacterium]|jgi:osmoprotectant transport system permease protein|nr:ABC transporter permease [Clostridiales Family XIII bacterium]